MRELVRRLHPLFAFLWLAAPLAAQTPPWIVNYQGRLTDNTPQQNPVNGALSMRFAIYTASSGGAPLWTEPASGGISVPVVNGVFSVQLGNNGVPLDATVFATGGDRWLEITLNPDAGNEELLAPRQRIASAGFAQLAAGAVDSAALGGVAPAGWQSRVSAQCAAGSSIRQINTDGSVVCQPDDSGPSYTNGPGLLLSSGQFSVDFAGSGTANSAARSDHTHAPPATRILSVTRTGPGTVSANLGGLSCGSACSAGYADGTVVTLTATPESGGGFVGWSGGGCTGSGACVVTLNAATSVNATFSAPLAVQRTGTGNGVITSTPAGINCGAACAAAFASGTQVTLSAGSFSDSQFAGWSGACSGLGSCSVTMDAARSVAATFSKAQFFVMIGRAGTGGGTVTSTPAGLNCGATCFARYDGGSTISLTAAPDATSSFSGWSGACVGTGGCTLSGLSNDVSVQATFTRLRYTLTTQRTGPGAVVSSPAGISCQPACSYDQDAGTPVTLTAVPDSGASFGDWSGACAGGGLCNLTLDANKSVTARFGYLLVVNRSGGGGGTVSASATPVGTPNGLNCGAACSFVYDPGAIVTLTATPDPNGTFLGWSGAGCSGTGTCVVTMSQAQSVTATFAMPLNVTRYNNGGGTVTSSPAGINCGGGGACSTSFVYGTSVVLTATPAAGGLFSAWNGCDSTSGNTCTVAINARRDVQATFQFPITVARNIAADGTVTGPSGMNCGATCSVYYNYNDPVSLLATPAGGRGFASWSGCDSTSGTTCNLAASGVRNVTANFSSPVTVTLGGNGAGYGSVTSSPAGINCGATCSVFFPDGASVSLTPSAATGASFTSWTGCDSVAGSTCNLLMNGAKSVTAVFTLNQYAITVTRNLAADGTVTSSPAGINCGATCSANFDHGVPVNLTAAPGVNHTIASWSGCDSVAGNTCTVVPTAARGVTVNFTSLLTVSKAGAGAATSSVTSAPAGISCGATCSVAFVEGATVTLTATAGGGFTFSGWTNCPSPSGNTCTVTMNGARTVTATFN